MQILAVDDGGGAEFAEIFEEVEKLGVKVLHHDINRGKGVALRTGFKYILDNMPDVDGVVTADCDGQHKIPDILNMLDAMEKNPDKMVLGGRFAGKDNNIPARSRFGNTVTRWVFAFATGLRIRDTQTGLRGIPRSLFENLLQVKGDRYEYEMNMLLSLKDWGCGFVEIPIETVYIENNKSSHYHPIKDSIRVFSQIIKFSMSSLICWVVDYVLFMLLNYTLLPGGGKVFLGLFSTAYILARIVSSALNYFLNKMLIFKKGGATSFFKYVLLVICVMAIGSAATHFLNILGLPAIVAKLIIEIPLYFVNFFVQKNWVFVKKGGK